MAWVDLTILIVRSSQAMFTYIYIYIYIYYTHTYTCIQSINIFTTPLHVACTRDACVSHQHDTCLQQPVESLSTFWMCTVTCYGIHPHLTHNVLDTRCCMMCSKCCMHMPRARCYPGNSKPITMDLPLVACLPNRMQKRQTHISD